METGKPSLTTETPTPPRENRACWGPRTRRHGENQEMQIMISISKLTSASNPLCSSVAFVVRGFSVLTIFVLTIFAGDSWRIGVKA